MTSDRICELCRKYDANLVYSHGERPSVRNQEAITVGARVGRDSLVSEGEPDRESDALVRIHAGRPVDDGTRKESGVSR